MQELWKSLKGVAVHGDNYEVSNLGNVRNTVTGKLLKGRMNRKGYLTVVLYLDGKTKHQAVHRLVAQAFIPNPRNKPQVNHINGEEKANNRVDNLEWATGHENIQHSFNNGLHKPRRGSSSNKAKLTEDQVICIKQKLSKGVSQYDLASEYKVSRGAIRDISTGKSWAHVLVAGFTAGVKDLTGENNSKAVLNADKVREIRKIYATGEYSSRKLAAMFGVSKPTILNIINGKTWSHVG